MLLKNFLKALVRRKKPESKPNSELSRCLNLLDLTALGVGGTLGLGLYVLAGSVAKTYAGPAICISFLLAAIVSAVAAICYAEFASRVPRAGSSYVYSYVSVGELPAFTIGWNVLVGCTIGTAGTSRGLSNYIDALTGYKIRDTLREWMPMDVNFLSEYPNFLSCALVVSLTAVIALGVKESSILNKIFVGWNLTTVAILIICGSIKADPKNWTIAQDQVPDGYGTGGFMPYGMAGVLTGAAKCFYGYIGFDVVATTGEEAKNPQRNVPLGIIFSSAIVFASYFSISTIVTMMVPYFEQDEDAPFPYAFNKVGWYAIEYLVTSGAICAISNSMFCGLFSLPRVSYSMASDGLIFKFFERINPWTKTPLIATIVLGTITAFMTTFFELDQLLDMTSISTFTTYSIVSLSVVILRYKPDKNSKEETKDFRISSIFNLKKQKYPSKITSRIANWAIASFCLFSGLTSLMLNQFFYQVTQKWYFCALLVLLVIGTLTTMVIIARQPSEKADLSFRVPLVPLIPCLSVFFNLYLMFQLDANAWVPFLITQILGFTIYFAYGIRHSEEANKERKF